MLRTPTGYATIVDPESPTIEFDTVTCGHCQRVIRVKPGTAATTYLLLDHQTLRYREEPGAACRVCMRPICLACCAEGRCIPWERRLERMEAKDRLIRSVLG